MSVFRFGKITSIFSNKVNPYPTGLMCKNTYRFMQYICLLLQRLQTLDENRINKLKSYIKQSADIERNVIPIINTCIDGMVKASDSVIATEVCNV